MMNKLLFILLLLSSIVHCKPVDYDDKLDLDLKLAPPGHHSVQSSTVNRKDTIANAIALTEQTRVANPSRASRVKKDDEDANTVGKDVVKKHKRTKSEMMVSKANTYTGHFI